MVTNLAVLLNSRAGGITSDFIEGMRQHYSGHQQINIFSEDEDLETVVDNLDDSKETIIVLGGGDGTIKYKVNQAIELFEERNLDFNQQKFALLKLGTGNGLSYEIGAGQRHNGQLEMILRNQHHIPTIKIPLIEVTGNNGELEDTKTYTPFTGVGWDAIMLSWYNQIKKMGPKGLFGYLGAVMPAVTEVLTNPKPNFQVFFPQGANVVFEDKGKVSIHNIYLDEDNRFIKGSEAHSIAAGTSKYFGFNFQAFPYAKSARERDMMHLRFIGGNRFITISELIGNAASVWKGRYRNKNVPEILAKEVAIYLSHNQVKMQAGGDDAGLVTRVNWKVSDYHLNLVDYRAMRH